MDVKAYFDLEPQELYLNHAAVAPWPQCTVKAVAEFAAENGSTGAKHYARWQATEQSLRDQLARLINADSADEIALQKNTSEALSVIAYGLDFKPGDNVVSAVEEFPSNRVVWQSLESKLVDLKLADLQSADDPEQALIDLIDDNTSLLSISAVQYASGLKMDLPRLGRACKERGVLFCVDAIQQLGALEFDVQACQADFVVADGHKWMCGAEGLALLYCRAEAMPKLALQQFGWHMLAATDFAQMGDATPAATARRFECGSPNMLGIIALQASLAMLEEIGMAEVEARLLANVAYLKKALSKVEGLGLLGSQEADRQSGILTFKFDDWATADVFAHLKSHGVSCAQRGGGIRFSPHFYTSHDVIDKAVACLDRVG